jgi:hypothetical protein
LVFCVLTVVVVVLVEPGLRVRPRVAAGAIFRTTAASFLRTTTTSPVLFTTATPTVTVTDIGRFGNQMFEYASLYAVAHTYNWFPYISQVRQTPL